MSTPLPPLPTQEEINRKLVWLSQQLDSAKEAMRVAIQNHAVRVRDATLIEAEAFMTAEGAMDLRKWVARAAAADAQFEVGVALAEVEAAKAHLWNLREQTGLTQTLSANVRAEVQLERSTPNVPSSTDRMRAA